MSVSFAGEFAGTGSADDLGQLYARLGRRVEKLVRAGVRAPDPVIEDACQFAWLRLIPRRQRVRPENILGWLTTTARHEALAQLHRDRGQLSWEALERRSETIPTIEPGPEEAFFHRERLGTVAGVPARQRRLLWLHGLGFSYAEIARLEGCTRRTVERQLLRAKRTLRTAAPTAPARASAACAQLD